MELLLPVTGQSANAVVLLLFGVTVGFIGAMFGIGGGFLMTPLLMFIGIPPGVAVASSASYIAASTLSSTLHYWRRRLIDAKLAAVLLAGALVGALTGVWLFGRLKTTGKLDFFVNYLYIVLLISVGGLMLTESLRTFRRARQGLPIVNRRPAARLWFRTFPLKVRFRRSKICVSAIPVCVIGYAMGTLGAMLGIGGGFILVPILIYMLQIPTLIVIGTSTAFTMTTMAVAAVAHAATDYLVDGTMTLLLVAGGIVGAQFGALATRNVSAERLRFLFGLLVFAVGLGFAFRTVEQP